MSFLANLPSFNTINHKEFRGILKNKSLDVYLPTSDQTRLPIDQVLTSEKVSILVNHLENNAAIYCVQPAAPRSESPLQSSAAIAQGQTSTIRRAQLAIQPSSNGSAPAANAAAAPLLPAKRLHSDAAAASSSEASSSSAVPDIDATAVDVDQSAQIGRPRKQRRFTMGGSSVQEAAGSADASSENTPNSDTS